MPRRQPHNSKRHTTDTPTAAQDCEKKKREQEQEAATIGGTTLRSLPPETLVYLSSFLPTKDALTLFSTDKEAGGLLRAVNVAYSERADEGSYPGVEEKYRRRGISFIDLSPIEAACAIANRVITPETKVHVTCYPNAQQTTPWDDMVRGYEDIVPAGTEDPALWKKMIEEHVVPHLLDELFFRVYVPKGIKRAEAKPLVKAAVEALLKRLPNLNRYLRYRVSSTYQPLDGTAPPGGIPPAMRYLPTDHGVWRGENFPTPGTGRVVSSLVKMMLNIEYNITVTHKRMLADPKSGDIRTSFGSPLEVITTKIHTNKSFGGCSFEVGLLPRVPLHLHLKQVIDGFSGSPQELEERLRTETEQFEPDHVVLQTVSNLPQWNNPPEETRKIMRIALALLEEKNPGLLAPGAQLILCSDRSRIEHDEEIHGAHVMQWDVAKVADFLFAEDQKSKRHRSVVIQ